MKKYPVCRLCKYCLVNNLSDNGEFDKCTRPRPKLPRRKKKKPVFNPITGHTVNPPEISHPKDLNQYPYCELDRQPQSFLSGLVFMILDVLDNMITGSSAELGFKCTLKGKYYKEDPEKVKLQKIKKLKYIN